MNTPNCPKCGKPLQKVKQSPNSMLNAEQFDAARAGDWFCASCPGNNRAGTGYHYFWDSDLTAAATAHERTASIDLDKLPPLPVATARMYSQNGYRRASVSAGKGEPLFAADQMRDYARAALDQGAQAGTVTLDSILNCYSPDDTISDYQDKIRALYAIKGK